MLFTYWYWTKILFYSYCTSYIPVSIYHGFKKKYHAIECDWKIKKSTLFSGLNEIYMFVFSSFFGYVLSVRKCACLRNFIKKTKNHWEKRVFVCAWICFQSSLLILETKFTRLKRGESKVASLLCFKKRSEEMKEWEEGRID